MADAALNQSVDIKKRRFLLTATGVVGGVGPAVAAVPFVMSFFPSARAKAAGAPVEVEIGKIEPGVTPTYESVADFSYPGARPLYLYVKAAHVKAIKSVTPFLSEFAKAWGMDGYLKTKGMVVAPEDVRTKNADIVSKMTLMDASGLK